MNSIPKRLLIHSVTYNRVGGKDIWENETLTNEDLTLVRMEPSDKLVQNKQNQEVRLSSLLFYDLRNSQGLGSEGFKLDDNITFQGRNYVITTIDALYDRNKLHHYEVGLV